MSADRFKFEVINLYESKKILSEEVFLLLDKFFAHNFNEAKTYYSAVRKHDIYTCDLINEFLNDIKLHLSKKIFLDKSIFHLWGSFGAKTNIIERKEIDILVQNLNLNFNELKQILQNTGNMSIECIKLLDFQNLLISDKSYNRLTFKYRYRNYEIDLKFIDNRLAEEEQIISYEKIKQIPEKYKILYTWAKRLYVNELIYDKLKNIWYRTYFNWIK